MSDCYVATFRGGPLDGDTLAVRGARSVLLAAVPTEHLTPREANANETDCLAPVGYEEQAYHLTSRLGRALRYEHESRRCIQCRSRRAVSRELCWHCIDASARIPSSVGKD